MHWCLLVILVVAIGGSSAQTQPPSSPRNLTWSLANNKQVTISWEPPAEINAANLSGYNVLLMEGNETLITQMEGPDVQQLIYGDLNAGKTFTIQVVAWTQNVDGGVLRSEPATGTFETKVAAIGLSSVKTQGPSKVSNIRATIPAAGAVNLTWEKPAEAINGYYVYKTNLVANKTDSIELPSENNSYTFNSLPPETRFKIGVSAYKTDSNNESVKVEGPQSFQLISVPVIGNNWTNLTAPTNVKVTAMENRTIVQWDSLVGNATKFIFAQIASPDESKGNFTGVTSKNISFETSVCSYFCFATVQSCSANNKTTCGLPAVLSLKANITAPSSPRNLTWSLENNKQVTISWEPPAEINAPNLSGYDVLLKEGNETLITQKRFPNDRQLIHGNLNAGKTFTIQVVAWNQNFDGDVLRSEPATETFETKAELESSKVWIYVLVVILIIAGAGGGCYFYRK